MIWYKEEQHLKEQLRYPNANRSLLLFNKSTARSLLTLMHTSVLRKCWSSPWKMR
jgi:hypothetical protein